MSSIEVTDIECKTNTIPTLMDQIRISTNKVSSVLLRPKKLKINPLVMTTKLSVKAYVIFVMSFVKIIGFCAGIEF
jgi:hypothetical protein